MTFEVLLNPSVKEIDELRLSLQARKIYDLLRQRSVTTLELAKIACQYCARLNEVRHALVPLGLMVDEIPGSGGQNRYHIVELSESVFWEKVQKKDEAWKWL